MKRLGLIILVGLLLIAAGVRAEDGKDIFSSHHCGTCHKADTGKANPSLKDIAQAYEGKETQLISYLKGETESIVNPAKGEAMKRYVEKTKALTDAERKALADFIMNRKN